MLEKKVNTTLVDCAVLNQLSQDFEKRFVPQTELSAKQAFWSQNSMNSPEPTHSSRPTKVEVPKELPKVSMVNTSLKKLKYHLVGFDVVVKERTISTAITEGSWGFEHTKPCFRDEIIPFVKALKDLFNTFDQYLIDELSKVQNFFHKMEQAVEQHRLESKTFEVKMNQVLNKNERLFEQVINKDIVNIIMNSSVDIDSVNMHECEKRLKLETGLLNKKDFIEKKIYDKLFKSFTILEKYCISLEEKVFAITALKDDLRKLKGKALVDNDVTKHPSDPEMLKIDMEPITPKLLNKRTTHPAYIKHTQEEATVLRDLVEHVKSKYLLDQSLESCHCNGCMLSDNHDLCVLDFINNVNARTKSKSVKKNSKRKVWKPTGKVLKSVSANKKEPSQSWGSIVFDVPSSSLDECQFVQIYWECFTISRGLPNVEGLGHNLFSVGKFCDSNLEVAFCQHTCFIFNLEGVDLLTGSRGNNLRNRTLIEDARTMLIYAKAPLFLWAEVVATACYTQNHSIVSLRHGKTPYELLHDKLLDLSFFHVFGALYYPTNDSENLGKLQSKADIDFDELTVMASEHSNLGPALHEMTPTTISSGLVPNPPLSILFIPPSRTDWDLLFQPMFDELLTPLPSVDCPAPKFIAPIAEVVASEPVVSTGSPSLTIVDQDAPSPSNSQTTPKTQSPIIPNDVEEDNHDLDVAHMNNDPFFGIIIPENNSEASSSDVIPTVVQTTAPYSEHVTKWTKDHPLDNIVGELERPVYTRLQLHEQALFCYYDAFLSSVEPKTYKDALTQSCWIKAMQEELNEFERLEV
ncbi:retrovirus-related pol polyprotein from transposon TNT 1-94 [Tanacetum coccineum]